MLPPELSDLLGERLTVDHAIREEHGGDESSHEAHPPDAVVFPQTTEEVGTGAGGREKDEPTGWIDRHRRPDVGVALDGRL